MIPYSQGCILLSDRQNTFDTGSKQERIKLLLLGSNGPVIGCAGESQLIENLFANITEEWHLLQGDSYTKFKKIFEKFLEAQMNIRRLTGAGIDPSGVVETILVEVQSGQITSFSATGLIRKKVACNNIVAIPTDFPEVQPYLKIDSKSLLEKEAIDLGEQILRQTCFFNYKVGPPEYHGYDYVKITPAGNFTKNNIVAKFPKLDPSQLIDKVRIVEEAV
jgi:hypothetical protein